MRLRSSIGSRAAATQWRPSTTTRCRHPMRTGAAFVMVMSTIDSRVLGSKLRDVPQPVWVAKPYALDDMLMTSGDARRRVRHGAYLDRRRERDSRARRWQTGHGPRDPEEQDEIVRPSYAPRRTSLRPWPASPPLSSTKRAICWWGAVPREAVACRHRCSETDRRTSRLLLGRCSTLQWRSHHRAAQRTEDVHLVMMKDGARPRSRSSSMRGGM